MWQTAQKTQQCGQNKSWGNNITYWESGALTFSSFVEGFYLLWSHLLKFLEKMKCQYFSLKGM